MGINLLLKLPDNDLQPLAIDYIGRNSDEHAFFLVLIAFLDPYLAST